MIFRFIYFWTFPGSLFSVFPENSEFSIFQFWWICLFSDFSRKNQSFNFWWICLFLNFSRKNWKFRVFIFFGDFVYFLHFPGKFRLFCFSVLGGFVYVWIFPENSRKIQSFQFLENLFIFCTFPRKFRVFSFSIFEEFVFFSNFPEKFMVNLLIFIGTQKLLVRLHIGPEPILSRAHVPLLRHYAQRPECIAK